MFYVGSAWIGLFPARDIDAVRPSPPAHVADKVGDFDGRGRHGAEPPDPRDQRIGAVGQGKGAEAEAVEVELQLVEAELVAAAEDVQEDDGVRVGGGPAREVVGGTAVEG